MGVKYTIGSMRRMYRPEAGRGSMRGARRTGKGQGRETACIKNPPFFIICTTVSRLIPGTLPGKPETELEQGPDKMLFYRDFVDRKVRFLYNRTGHIQPERKTAIIWRKIKKYGLYDRENHISTAHTAGNHPAAAAAGFFFPYTKNSQDMQRSRTQSYQRGGKKTGKTVQKS